MAYGLSKSKLMAYHQCHRKLWLGTHRKDLIPEEYQNQVAFTQGHAVGAAARALIPGGLLIETRDLAEARRVTAEALASGKRQPLFEATFSHAGCLVQADALIPDGSGYRLCEVKSSGKVKPEHAPDCAIQTWVSRGAGLNVTRTELVHLNTDFVYRGNGDYQGLFTHEVMDDKIESLLKLVPEWIRESQEILERKEPKIATGAHCHKPYDCPFIEHCSKGEPAGPDYPVTILPNSGGKALARQLQAQGYEDLRKVPERLIPDGLFKRIWAASRSGQALLEPGAAKIITALPYPRYYFDFETIGFPVPTWIGTRPWQQVPFQWSCHIEQKDGSAEHEEFLDLSGDNPARACAKSMLAALGSKGAIIVYYESFEKTRIRELAEMYPDLAARLLALLPRVVDLLPITRDHYYHPAMMGSFSIKNVIPTIESEMAYSDSDDINDGSMAQEAYLEATAASTTIQIRNKLQERLLRYCRKDTLVMLRICNHYRQ